MATLVRSVSLTPQIEAAVVAAAAAQGKGASAIIRDALEKALLHPKQQRRAAPRVGEAA